MVAPLLTMLNMATPSKATVDPHAKVLVLSNKWEIDVAQAQGRPEVSGRMRTQHSRLIGAYAKVKAPPPSPSVDSIEGCLQV